MAASELFKRYIWLVDLIYGAGPNGITRDEINRKWASCDYNESHETEIPERTFHRHKDAIKELFDINIVCGRCGGRVYRIENQDDIKHDGVRSWLLNTFAVNNLINESHHLKQRILFEEIPSGQRFLTPIIEAMRDDVTITITYQSFNSPQPYTFEIEPWCVKVHSQRWYVLGRSVYDGKIRVYGLDRMKMAEPTQTKFKLPKGFDAESYFNDVIGVIVAGGESVEIVKVKVTDQQQCYFRSLPLHHSQEEKVIDDDCSIFTYFLKPTFDFIQELLKYGSSVEVLKPEWLRQEMISVIDKMRTTYSVKK
jgi:hypothetical protein